MVEKDCRSEAVKREAAWNDALIALVDLAATGDRAEADKVALALARKAAGTGQCCVLPPSRSRNAEVALHSIYSLGIALDQLGVDLIEQEAQSAVATSAGVLIKSVSRELRLLAEIVASEVSGRDAHWFIDLPLGIKRMFVEGYAEGRMS